MSTLNAWDSCYGPGAKNGVSKLGLISASLIYFRSWETSWTCMASLHLLASRDLMYCVHITVGLVENVPHLFRGLCLRLHQVDIIQFPKVKRVVHVDFCMPQSFWLLRYPEWTWGRFDELLHELCTPFWFKILVRVANEMAIRLTFETMLLSSWY